MDTFYWVHWISFDEDKNMIIKTSGYDDESSHYVNYTTIKITDEEYDMWQWMYNTQERKLITQSELDRLKKVYESQTM